VVIEVLLVRHEGWIFFEVLVDILVIVKKLVHPVGIFTVEIRVRTLLAGNRALGVRRVLS
jgi:hypothetical protein